MTNEALAHRRGQATVTVLDPSGAPVVGVDLQVSQVDQAFGFGNIGFDLIALANNETRTRESVFGGAPADRAEALAGQWLDLFNQATLPFYWAEFEPERGHPETGRLRRAARWFVERGVRVKGHCLLWHTLAPHWLLGLTDDEVERTIGERIAREVGDFAGLVGQWDALNEPVIMPVFDREQNAVTRLAALRGRVHMIRLAFEAARAANPTARYVLNDFDLSEDYEHLIAECLEAGITIDAIGLQTHMHQGYRGEDEVLAVVDRFARFGLPLQLTETTLVSGHLMPSTIVDLNDYQVPSWPSTTKGEERQADEIVRHYRSLYGHPAVESITYWGLADEGSWLGAPGGLVRIDGTPKPAYEALRELIRGEWWTPATTLRTDAAGQVTVEGFAGRYRLTTPATLATIDVPAGRSRTTVTVA